MAAGRSPGAARVQGLLALRAGADPIPTSRRNRFASPHRDRATRNIRPFGRARISFLKFVEGVDAKGKKAVENLR